jgi:hypothetical protein
MIELSFPGKKTPAVDEVLRKIGPRKKYFCCLDLSSSYWQIPISKKTRGIMAFITDVGKFVWNKRHYSSCLL